MSETLPMWGKVRPEEHEPTVAKSRPRAELVRPLRERPAMLAPVIEAPIVDTAGAWQSTPTVQEIGTPVHRSLATLIRSAPVVVLLIVLGAPLTWFTVGGWDWAWGVAIMGGLGLVGTLGVLWLDLTWNSPSSTERHRINKAFVLKRQELRQTHELRRVIVEAYIEHMEGDDNA